MGLLVLDVVEGPVAGTVLRVRAGAVKALVGRTKHSAVHVKDPAVSQKHAELRWDASAGGWAVVDVGSSNGTRVNGKECAEGVAVPLAEGDRVTFGTDSVAVVRLEDPSAAPGGPPAAAPAPAQLLTVERFVDAAVEKLCAEARAHAEDLARQIEDDARARSAELRAQLAAAQAA